MRKNPEALSDYWQERIRREWVMRPGQHIMEIGIPGTGKTNGLAWLEEALVEHVKSVQVWFDCCKSSEILMLSTLGPVQVLIPAGMELEIRHLKKDLDITITEVEDLKDPWPLLERDRINVISFEPYTTSPAVFVGLMRDLFDDLVKKAQRYALPTPMDIFFDEFHRVAPSKGYGIFEDDDKHVQNMIANIERLRSSEIRFAVSTQGYNKIHKGVRMAFNYFLARRGTDVDNGKMKRYLLLHEKLETDEAVFWFENKDYSDVLHLPFYGDGKNLGQVRYHGILKEVEKPTASASEPAAAAGVSGAQYLEQMIANLRTAIEALRQRGAPEKEIALRQRDLSLLMARRVVLGGEGE
ncbi:MAG: hypothetical protein WC683_15720 [bacterium]